MEYVLLSILLLAALFIIIAVIFQKSSDEGLSGAISGGNETFYGRDKAGNSEKAWFKWTLIASLIFAVAVLVAFIMQPDYFPDLNLDTWHSFSKYGDVFKK